MCTSITPFSALTACFESVMAHETKSTHRFRPQLAQKCVNFKKQKLPEELGAAKNNNNKKKKIISKKDHSSTNQST